MALSTKAIKSLSGLWGSYDFYLIRDRHFKTASDMVERFLDVYQCRWTNSSRPLDIEFKTNAKQVLTLLTEWAEKKLSVVISNDSIQTLQSNIMFKELHYSREAISFGASGLNWRTKIEIASELKKYKPWSVAHAAEMTGGKTALQQHMRSIVKREGAPVETIFFEGWWNLMKDIDRPMLFPQVWGHTSGKLWLNIPQEAKPRPAIFSFGLVNVVSKSKVLIQCDTQARHSVLEARKIVLKQNLAANNGWLVFQFGHAQINNNLTECFDTIKDYLYY